MKRILGGLKSGPRGWSRVYSLSAGPILPSQITQRATHLCINLCPHFLLFPWNRLPGGELQGKRGDIDLWSLILIGKSLSLMDMLSAWWQFYPTVPLLVIRNKYFKIPLNLVGDKWDLLFLSLIIWLLTRLNLLIATIHRCLYFVNILAVCLSLHTFLINIYALCVLGMLILMHHTGLKYSFPSLIHAFSCSYWNFQKNIFLFIYLFATLCSLRDLSSPTNQGLNLGPQQWTRWVLSTGPPGNSLKFWHQ